MVFYLRTPYIFLQHHSSLLRSDWSEGRMGRGGGGRGGVEHPEVSFSLSPRSVSSVPLRTLLLLSPAPSLITELRSQGSTIEAYAEDARGAHLHYAWLGDWTIKNDREMTMTMLAWSGFNSNFLRGKIYIYWLGILWHQTKHDLFWIMNCVEFCHKNKQSALNFFHMHVSYSFNKIGIWQFVCDKSLFSQAYNYPLHLISMKWAQKISLSCL